jgi:hypothetical protein
MRGVEAVMKLKPIAIVVLAALALLARVPHAAAQSVSSPIQQFSIPTLPPPAGRRITIYPGRPLYRRCVDWYELQYRPSGTVLFPQMHCWWVRG